MTIKKSGEWFVDEYLRRLVEAGQHEHIMSGLNIVYQGGAPMPTWLYDALANWLVRTETKKQRQERRQRAAHEWRHALVAHAKAEGLPDPEAFGDAAGASEGTAVEGGEDVMRKSYKKVRAAQRRAGIETVLVKKSGQKRPKKRK